MIYARYVEARELPLDELELDDLIRRCGEGDASAFDPLVERYYPAIFRLAYRMLGDRDAAQDATQEAFLKAWEKLSGFRKASKFATWLHSIAIHHCLNLSRRNARERSRIRSIDAGYLPEAAGEDIDLEGWSRRRSLHEAIGKLPDKLKEAIILRYYSDYAPKEIAEILDIPLRTVYFRLESAQSRLGRMLNDEETR